MTAWRADTQAVEQALDAHKGSAVQGSAVQAAEQAGRYKICLAVYGSMAASLSQIWLAAD